MPESSPGPRVAPVRWKPRKVVMSRVPGVVSITDLARRASACLWSERQYLAWLAAADLDNDPLTRTDGRDWAVRDYRTHLNLQREGVPSPSRDATKRRLPASRDSDTVSGRRALGTLPRAADPPQPVLPTPSSTRSSVRRGWSGSP